MVRLSVQLNVAHRESYYKWLVRVEGLNYSESRQLTERLGEPGERLQADPSLILTLLG